LRNFNKQNLILAKFYVSNETFIGNQRAKFQLNFPTQTIVIAAFVRSPQSMKCPVLGNRLFNLDSVYGLLGYSAINLLAPYPFSCLNSLTKAWSSAEITIFLLFTLLFTLIASTNVTSDRATAVAYVTPCW